MADRLVLACRPRPLSRADKAPTGSGLLILLIRAQKRAAVRIGRLQAPTFCATHYNVNESIALKYTLSFINDAGEILGYFFTCNNISFANSSLKFSRSTRGKIPRNSTSIISPDLENTCKQEKEIQ